MAGNVTVEGAVPIEVLREWQQAEGDAITMAWILLCAFFVISMQLGFAMVEVGSVRHTHRMTVLAKNIMDSTVSCLAFWAYREVSSHFGDHARSRSIAGMSHPKALFQWAFCATSVTVCSGAMAERTHMLAYLLYAAVMAGLIYPVLADSAWSTAGLLYEEFHERWTPGYSYHDFAGSGIVHFVGGVSACVGNAIVGRRIVRPPLDGDIEDVIVNAASTGSYPELARPKEGWPRRFDSKLRDSQEFRPMNYLQVLGMFTLWIGWYGFNAGSTFCMSHTCGIEAGIIAWNTTLAACTGGIGAYIYSYAVSKHLHTGVICNGILGGLVAITASCDIASEEQAALIGLTAGLLIYPASSFLVQRWRLDDPVDAIAVHMFCGLWGTMCVALCRPDCRFLETAEAMTPKQARFCSDSYSIGPQMLAQLWGLFTAFWWTAPMSLCIWVFFALFEIMRSLEEEHFEIADEALSELAPTAQHEQDLLRVADKLRRSSSQSPLLRDVLVQHGWIGVGFAAKLNVPLLRDELHCVRTEKLESGLEIKRWRVLRLLAQFLHGCRPVRHCAQIRLRISPLSELSGLGTLDFAGGQLLGLVRRLKETQAEADLVPMRQQVHELNQIVSNNQELLVRALSRHRGRSSDRAYLSRRAMGLPSVPEQSQAAQGSEGSGADQPNPLGTAHVVLPPLSSPDAAAFDLRQLACSEATPSITSSVSSTGSRRPLRSSPAAPSGLTRSEASSSTRTASMHGAITPRSGHEETPPPSVIGHLSAGAGDRPAAPLQVHDVAGQLVAMMQAQQQLLSVLAQAQTPTSLTASGTSTPEPATLGQQPILAAALQNLVAQGPQYNSETRSSASFSTASVSPRRRM